MTNNPNPNPQQNKPSSSIGQPQSGRTDANAGNRQDAGRTQGPGETQQFGGIRGSVEQGYGSEKSRGGSSQEIERCLSSIEDNVRKLRDAIGASSSSASMGRSESSERSSSASSSSNTSNPGQSNQPGRNAGR